MCHYFNFSYDGKSVKTAPSSKYDHYLTSLGKIDNNPIVVGHCGLSNGKKVEALQDGKWNVLSDYPFVEERIYAYSMVNFKDVLYLFGK